MHRKENSYEKYLVGWKESGHERWTAVGARVRPALAGERPYGDLCPGREGRPGAESAVCRTDSNLGSLYLVERKSRFPLRCTHTGLSVFLLAKGKARGRQDRM